MFDKSIKEECGVFGITNNKDSAINTTLALHALQHRGQEACGIVTSSLHEKFSMHFVQGLVGDNLSSEEVISKLSGTSAIGHVRYSTVDYKNMKDCQPIVANFKFGQLAVAHNGNIVNAKELKEKLVNRGAIFQSEMDSEIIIHLIAFSTKESLSEKIIEALCKIKGAYSLLILYKDQVIAVRDPFGIRPLSLGKLGDKSYCIASETCAFDIIDGNFIRDIKRGEMIIIKDDNIQSFFPFPEKKSKFCIFEYIYFSRPDSVIDSKNVYTIRKNIGIELAKEADNFADADIVVPIPDSGIASAIGYAKQSKIPLELGIIRNHYVGRTFIEPSERVRNFGVKLKHNANYEVIKNKKVILIDDSIVRGTTSKKIVQMIKDAGAKSIYMAIASPPIVSPCFYGVDTPSKKNLIAANYTIDKIRKILGLDKLLYISIDGLYKAIINSKRNNNDSQYCDACLTQEYPIEIY